MFQRFVFDIGVCVGGDGGEEGRAGGGGGGSLQADIYSSGVINRQVN